MHGDLSGRFQAFSCNTPMSLRQLYVTSNLGCKSRASCAFRGTDLSASPSFVTENGVPVFKKAGAEGESTYTWGVASIEKQGSHCSREVADRFLAAAE
jgi:hypothetical protein